MASRDISSDIEGRLRYIIGENLYIDFIDKKVFSMNEVWNNLISENKLCGLESNQKFYHLNTEEMYKKISKLGIID